MLKNKPRKPGNYRLFGTPRGRHYRRNKAHGRYLIRPIDRVDSKLNPSFASRTKARAYARQLADALGKQVSMIDLDMGRCKKFNPRSRTKC
jgi:hypothetical protein